MPQPSTCDGCDCAGPSSKRPIIAALAGQSAHKKVRLVTSLPSVQTTDLPEVLVLEPLRFSDARGWFCETWSAPALAKLGSGSGAELGLDQPFVQDNHSYSARRGTLRGLHYQAPPHAQDKLVRCSRGAILDVAVDVRHGSPRYGHWVGVTLSAENGLQLFVPKGFLHGFVTLQDETEVQYKCSDIYAPDCDGAVHFASLGIDWGFEPASLHLSEKDARAPDFADWISPFRMDVA